SLFFGNVRGPANFKFSFNDAGDRTGQATGIGTRTYTANLSSGSTSMTSVSSTVGLRKGMLVLPIGAGSLSSGTHITNISGSTITLSAAALSNQTGQTFVFCDAVKVGGSWIPTDRFDQQVAIYEFNELQAYRVTPPEGGYNRTYVVETLSRAASAQTIQATRGSEFTPTIPDFDGTPLPLSQDVWPGGLMWSKPDEPEHVEPLSYLFVGDQSKAILALVPTRDALFILKEDGIFRLTGANGVWRVDPFDPTARCMLPGSVRAVRGRGVFLGDRGIAMVSDEGVEMVSASVNDLVKPLIDQIQASWLSTGFYELPGMQGAHASCVFERESEYTLARGSSTAPLVFNDITGAWTTLAYYAHANESLAYKALFNFERAGSCVLSMGVSYYKTLLSTDAGADYLRYDRATAVTVNSYVAPNATLASPVNALEDDIIKDSAGRYWRVTADVSNSATVPVVLGGGTAAMATGAGTLYRSLRCSVIATGFGVPLASQKQWGAFNAAWTKLVGVARLRYGWQSSESPTFVEQDVYTSLARPALASGNGVTNYPLGLAEPADIVSASARAWFLRARIRWAMAHGDAQLEGIFADLIAGPPPRGKQQVAA
ncbi:MAG TPA: hypothetical protein VED01_03225, partial [Burkholderiales bacterium]|nr:hypothetical protein [Burkholderiales bacterium]